MANELVNKIMAMIVEIADLEKDHDERRAKALYQLETIFVENRFSASKEKTSGESVPTTLSVIRQYIFSDPDRIWTVAAMKQMLGVKPEDQKVLYAALSRLTKNGEIERIDRATYQTKKKGETPTTD